jgi:spermidine synthase
MSGKTPFGGADASRPASGQPAQPSRTRDGTASARTQQRAHDWWRWRAVFSAAGGLALGVQVYLLREYMVLLQGDEAAVGLGLAAWFGGIAAGAAIARWLRRVRPGRGAALALAMLSLSGWAAVLLARLGRSVFALPPGELLPLGPALLLALPIFAVPGALVGGGFVALAASAALAGTDARAAIGRLYVYEAIGSLVAGLIVSLVLIPAVAPLSGLALLLAVGLAAATPAARAGLVGGRWTIPALSGMALLAALPPCAQRLESATQRARFATLVTNAPLLDWDDTPYQYVAIGGADVRVLYSSGQYVASFPDPFEDESRAHQLMLLAQRPARVLAFGGLETGALRFCLRHPVQRFDLVYLDARALSVIHRHLDPADRAVLADPRVRVIFDDPRRFLAHQAEPYDLVLFLQPDPATLLLARGTTVEFSRLVAARLAPDGVYVTRFSTGANVQAGETGVMGASLYRSLREVFPVVHAAPGPDGLLVAGNSPDSVTLDPPRLAARWRARTIQSDVFVPELLPLLFPPERVATLEGELARDAANVTSTSDDRPVSFLHALRVRQQLARSAWAGLLDWSASHPARLALAGLAPSLLLLVWLLVLRPRRGSAVAAVHATAVTGACGMAWSLMLFFSFQTRVGALYSQLGMLTGVFMLGLAAGGAWAARRVACRGLLLRAQAVSLAAAALLAFSFAAVGILTSWPLVLAIVHALLLAVAGGATGVLVPSAAAALLERGAQAQSAAGLVELADHGGAALAALVAAVLFVPVFGLKLAALLLVVLQALALAATAGAARGGPARLSG